MTGRLPGRGRIALAMAGLAYLAAWAFGSKLLYPVAVGLGIAVALAFGAVRLSAVPMRLRREAEAGDNVEGADLRVRLELEVERRLAGVSVHLVEHAARLGTIVTPLTRHGQRQYVGEYELKQAPRGRYRFDEARVVLEDPFGLQRADVLLHGTGGLVVYPRLAELHGLFSDSGSTVGEGRRLLLRRPTGFDLHSVREYEEGESLRKVHWPSTAKRGELMVKELEDAPRDELVVLLDATSASVVGRSPDSSFDAQVRAAGSILRAQTRRGRAAALVVASAAREVVTVRSESDWRAALEVLAAVEPTGRHTAADFLVGDESRAARAFEIAVVTAVLGTGLVERLVERAQRRSAVSCVYVEASTFGDHASTPFPRYPELLRLRGAGISVAVLRRGDDLASVLSGEAASRAAHG